LSFTNFATKAFHPSARAAAAGGQRAGRPAGSADPDDFAFAIDSGDGLALAERYFHATERWEFHEASAAAGGRAALALDVALTLAAPGYLPTTPTGVEEEGYSRDGRYNPETMYGLSYYYYAPKLTLTGTIAVGNETHRVAGTAWLEHQWGNFSTADPEAYRWRWGSLRFTDGGGINWRQWERGPDNAPVPSLNHYAIHTPDGAVTYGYGRDLTYDILDVWVSPRTGRRYGIYAVLQTPVGTFYVSPIVADQEIVIPGLTAPLWEGALEVRRGGSDGPVVGRMYMEEQFGVSHPPLPPPGPLARQLPLSGVHGPVRRRADREAIMATTAAVDAKPKADAAPPERRGAHRAASILTVAMLALVLAALPFAIRSMAATLFGDQQDTLYDLVDGGVVPPTVAAPTAADQSYVNIAVVNLDPATGLATLAVSGNRVCPGTCPKVVLTLL
ncbi:MAG TPA: lipocalin family protein, partial [Thermomicrobiales bacterium]|nr:lipocalin family protein [Thermomicrobiales bacterium]